MQILAHMARARLRDRHQDNLRKKLQVLKAEQAVVTTAPQETHSSGSSTPKISQTVKVDNEEGPSTSKINEDDTMNSNER